MVQQHPIANPVQPNPHDPDEIVHTPTKHRARWIMGILLLILILTTFTVSDQLKDLMTGHGSGAPYVRWNRPGAGEQAITGQEWQACMRSLDKLYKVLGRDLDDGEMKNTVAETLLVGALAQDSGIAVTDKELGEFIVARFGSAQNYHLILPQYRITPKEFESTLRQRLIVERYTSLMAGAWTTADVAEIEKTWKTQHQEYAFDYVMLPIESQLAEAKKVPVTDEELHAYFDALPQPKKDSFKSKEKLAADLVGLAYEGAATDALFEHFPKPTDEAEIEKQAKAYYDGFGLRRFAGKPYEEVKDKARAEALVYASLQAWLADARSRQDKGLAVNVGADAAALGLTMQHMTKALERSEWLAAKPAEWIGTQPASLLFGNTTDVIAGKFYPNVIVDETGFTLVLVNTKEEPAMPAFEELADKLREEFWQKRAKEFAVARLEALRDSFGTRPPVPAAGEPPAPPFLPEVEEAKFYEVVRAAKFEPQLRDFKERMPPVGAEPPAPIDLYARTQATLYSGKPGTVPAAGSDFEAKNAYLLRVRGARDPDPARMKANEFANAESGLQQAAEAEFRLKTFSLNALQTRYGLVFNEKQSGG